MTTQRQSTAIVIRPNSGPQSTFLASPADIAIYGGAAGGGKTYALLMEPLRHIRTSGFGALLFRETYRQVMIKGGMWDQSSELYRHFKPKPSFMLWKFPSGATVGFSYLQHENDKYNYDGAQIPLLGFDQLEQFSESQFFYLLARNRSTCGVRPYLRATCNPDPDSWLAGFLSYWIDQETGYAIPERSGKLRYFVRFGEELVWGGDPDDLRRRYPSAEPVSVTFVPSSVYDNKDLLEHNPEYLSRLLALPPVEQERLLRGNWKIRLEAGNLFNRSWFEVVPAAPAGGVYVRFFDFAATERKVGKGRATNDPDYTAGVLLALVDGTYYVVDCVAEQVGPTDAENLFYNVVSQDLHMAARLGVQYKVRWEVEGGSAGKREAVRMVKELTRRFKRIDALGVYPTGDKIQRAKPLAMQAKAGNVKVVSGSWSDAWITHMHNQPGAHDDIMDASSGAFEAHAETGWSRGASN